MEGREWSLSGPHVTKVRIPHRPPNSCDAVVADDRPAWCRSGPYYVPPRDSHLSHDMSYCVTVGLREGVLETC